MTSMAQIRYFPLVCNFPHHQPRPFNLISFNPPLQKNQNCEFSLSLSLKYSDKTLFPRLQSRTIRFSSGGGGGDGGGGRSSGDHGDDENSDESSSDNLGCIGLFFKGLQSGVSAHHQSPLKAMEEQVGISACILGSMAPLPRSQLGELVSSIGLMLIASSTLNLFFQMCLLKPPSSPSPRSLMLAAALQHHAFMGKLALLAAVGFAAGLAGTALRKKMDPSYRTPNNVSPLLNDSTRVFYYGCSSRRLRVPHGAEFVMAQSVPPFVCQTAFFVLSWLFELATAMPFTILAREATTADEGSQSDKSSKLIS